MMKAPTYQSILQQLNKTEDNPVPLRDRKNTVAEIAKNLAEVKTHLMNRLSILETYSQAEESEEKYGGAKITILVENHQCKVEKLQTALSAKRPRFVGLKQKWKKHDHEVEDDSQTPFNSKSKRFTSMGPHPRLYQKANIKFKDDITPGPTSYSPDCSRELTIDDLIHRGWKLKPERDIVLKLSQIAMKEHEQELIRRRGPGRYKIEDINPQCNRNQPSRTFPQAIRNTGDPPISSSKQGHLHRNRLYKSMVVPGVGSHKIKEPSRVENSKFIPFDFSVPHQIHEHQGSGLSPASYNLESSVDILLKKMCSVKGPYELFTGSRDGRINIGSSRKKGSLFQSKYMSAQLSSSGRPSAPRSPEMTNAKVKSGSKKNGKLSVSLPNTVRSSVVKADEALVVPGENRIAERLGRCEHRKPIAKVEKQKHVSSKATVLESKWRDTYGFLSSTKREDKQYKTRWGYGMEVLGPGRYNLDTVKRNKVMHKHSSLNSSAQRKLLVKRPLAQATKEAGA